MREEEVPGEGYDRYCGSAFSCVTTAKMLRNGTGLLLSVHACAGNWSSLAPSGWIRPLSGADQEGAGRSRAAATCNLILSTSPAIRERTGAGVRNTTGRAGTPGTGAGGAEVGRGRGRGDPGAGEEGTDSHHTAGTCLYFRPPIRGRLQLPRHISLPTDTLHSQQVTTSHHTRDNGCSAMSGQSFPAPLGLCSLTPSAAAIRSIHHSLVGAIPGNTVGCQRSQCLRSSSCDPWIKAHLQS